MPNLEIEISASFIWHQQQGDCSKCDACKDIIVSDMFVLFFFIEGLGNPFEPIETNTKLCSSCYDCIK